MAGSVAEFIRVLRKQIGEPYVWGADGPNQFDCSGFVYYGLNQAGAHVPRLTANGYMHAGFVGKVRRQGLQRGDLIFFNYGRLGGGQADHVGIFLGGGRMINAANSREDVKVESVDWGAFIGGGRVKRLSGGGGGAGGGGGGGEGGGPGRFTGFGPKAKSSKRDLNALLAAYGLRPALFQNVIDKAIRGNWSDTHFLSSVYQSRPFRKAFPGITREDGSLRYSPEEYLALRDQFSDVAAQFGMKLSKGRFGKLLDGDVSVDEWVSRAQIGRDVRQSDELRKAFNSELTRKQRKTLNKKGWFNFLAGEAESELYDLYESARLTTAGIEVSRQGAQRIGGAGELVDLDELIGQVQLVKDFVAPELRAAGISDEDLTALQAGGADPANKGDLLDQVLRNREKLLETSRRGGKLTPVGGGLFPSVPEGV